MARDRADRGPIKPFRERLLPWWVYVALVVFLLVGAANVVRDDASDTPLAVLLFMFLLAVISVGFAVVAHQTQHRREQD